MIRFTAIFKNMNTLFIATKCQIITPKSINYELKTYTKKGVFLKLCNFQKGSKAASKNYYRVNGILLIIRQIVSLK
jgi:hypothetical protein